MRDLFAMPNRKTVIDPASQAPLPPGWTIILIVVGAAMAVAVVVALIMGFLAHHPPAHAQVNGALRPPHLSSYSRAGS